MKNHSYLIFMKGSPKRSGVEQIFVGGLLGSDALFNQAILQLPVWLRLSNWITLVAFAFTLSAVASTLAGLVAVPFKSLRRMPDSMHWSVRARESDPLRRSLNWLLLLLPVLCGAVGMTNAGPTGVTSKVLMGVSGSIFAFIGVSIPRAYFFRKIGFPLGSKRNQFYEHLAAVFFVAPHLMLSAGLIMLIAAGILNRLDLLLVVVVIATLALLAGVDLALARALGLLRSVELPTETLARIAARKMGVPVPRVFQVPVQTANAWAWPHRRVVAISEGALPLMSPPELESVFAHEIGHLSENLSRRLARVALLVLPQMTVVFVFYLMTLGYSLMVAAIAACVLLSLFGMQFGKRLAGAEHDADQNALAVTENPVDYARALEKMYENNLLPAVFGMKSMISHPDLYDRLQSAGMTPTFSRPLPPSRLRAEFAVGLAFFLAFSGASALKTAPLFAAVGPLSSGINTWLAIGIDGGTSPLGLAKVAEGEHERKNFATSKELFRMAAQSTQNPALYMNYALAAAAGGECKEAKQAVAIAQLVFDQNEAKQAERQKRPDETEIADFVRTCVPKDMTAH